MADLFNTVNQLSILLGGRRPEWIRQIDASYPNGLPDSGDGVALRDSPRTQILLDMREQIRHRTARIALRVVDLTGVYRIFIDANPVDFDAGAVGAASPLDILTGWADAINTDGTVGPIVSASVEDGAALLIRGNAEADYTVGVTMPSGSAEVDVLADPVSADARVYLADKPPKAQGAPVPNASATGFTGILGSGDWRQPNGGDYSVGFRGFCEFFDTSGYDRLYVELLNVSGPADTVVAPHTFTLTPRITVGPSILE